MGLLAANLVSNRHKHTMYALISLIKSMKSGPSKKTESILASTNGFY